MSDAEYVRPLLVVDDDKKLCGLIREYLEPLGYRVSMCHTGPEGLQAALEGSYEAVILDVMMPGMDGIEVLKELRKKSTVPVLMLTAMGEESDRIAGLEMGADDYLPKPFEPRELDLRIKNIINKTKKNNLKKIIEFENVKIDLNKQIIFHGNSEFKINNTEKTILEEMINNPGKVFEREEIGKLIDLDKERSIDVIITRLRKKIEIDPKNPKFFRL